MKDQRLADVIHAFMDLIDAVQDVDQEGYDFEDGIKKNGGKRLGVAGCNGVGHAAGQCDQGGDNAEGEVLPGGVLSFDVGNLVGVHAIQGQRREDVVHGHGERKSACRLVSVRKSDNENGDKPLACKVSYGAEGVPCHVLSDGKLLAFRFSMLMRAIAHVRQRL